MTVVVIGVMLLGWQVIRAPLVERAPPALAIRLAPRSTSVLARAAESELLAGRQENARQLAREALARAPFNVRALRVLGLVTARQGQPEAADPLLTLAGNWSLRDDPAHAWLVEYRLRRGDFASAFSHADTIVRRRGDSAPAIFNLFTTSATLDRRALPALIARLSVDPPWREGYIRSLYETDKGAPILASIVIALDDTAGRFNDEDLSLLYQVWKNEGRIPAMKAVRERLNRPNNRLRVVDGGFSDPSELVPFAWTVGAESGLEAIVTEDDSVDRNVALRVSYDGASPVPVIAEQMLTLAPGPYRLKYRMRAELGEPPYPFAWTLTCFEAPTDFHRSPLRAPSAGETGWWSPESDFEIPASGCSAQYLRLVARPAVEKSENSIWFDDIEIQSTNDQD